MVNAIFLDRDGIINKQFVEGGIPRPPRELRELSIVDGIEELIRSFHWDGFLVIVISNQPDAVRKKAKKSELIKINNYLKNKLNLDDMFVCYHDDKDNCDCRKPKIGLITRAKEKYNIDLSKSWMIGDRWKDIEAGKSAGCRTIFIDHGYKERRPEGQDYTFSNIFEVMLLNLKGGDISCD